MAHKSKPVDVQCTPKTLWLKHEGVVEGKAFGFIGIGDERAEHKGKDVWVQQHVAEWMAKQLGLPFEIV